DEVALGLGHLLAVEADHADVQVVVGIGSTGDAPGLGRAHLVVREDQIAAAPVEVEGRAQTVQRDGTALDVPSGPAATQRTVPGGFSGTFGTPQQPVEGVLLARALWIATAFAEQLQHLGTAQVADPTESFGLG